MKTESCFAAVAIGLFALVPHALAAVTCQIHFDAAVQSAPVTGRLIVFVQKAKSPTTAAATTQNVSEGDHLYGIDVASLRPGDHATVDDAAASYPQKLSTLSGGRYEAQALLRIHHDDSNWRRESGNLYSQTVSFNVDASPSTVDIKLSMKSAPSTQPSVPGAEVFSIRSRLLSDFHHRDMFLRAAVIFPRKPNPAGNAAIYRVPGFGGNGISIAANPLPKLAAGSPAAELADKTFTIWLDPESGNGHTLFADSDNNGPMGDALVSEFIPALERKYHLVSNPNARILQGHSSGGWAVLWLATQYPQTFGACFCASPDPVDFRQLEMIDIYHDENAYRQGNIDTLGSRSGSRVRDENAIEEVLGPHNTSGHDWDAWQAVWGHRNPAGHPAALFEWKTGTIDRAEAKSYRRFDISDLLARNPDKYAPLFRERIRLIVGDKDNFFLDKAVSLLKERLNVIPDRALAPEAGYIKVLPNYTHATIGDSPEFLHWPREQLDFLSNMGASPMPSK